MQSVPCKAYETSIITPWYLNGFPITGKFPLARKSRTSNCYFRPETVVPREILWTSLKITSVNFAVMTQDTLATKLYVIEDFRKLNYRKNNYIPARKSCFFV